MVLAGLTMQAAGPGAILYPLVLGAVLAGDRSIADITVDGPSGIRVIPAGSGVRALTHLTDLQWQRLAASIDEASATLDFLVVDTASGISDNVLDLVDLVDYALFVTSYEPAAVVDSYATVKLISAADRTRDIGIARQETADLLFYPGPTAALAQRGGCRPASRQRGSRRRCGQYSPCRRHRACRHLRRRSIYRRHALHTVHRSPRRRSSGPVGARPRRLRARRGTLPRGAPLVRRRRCSTRSALGMAGAMLPSVSLTTGLSFIRASKSITPS